MHAMRPPAPLNLRSLLSGAGSDVWPILPGESAWLRSRRGCQPDWQEAGQRQSICKLSRRQQVRQGLHTSLDIQICAVLLWP